MAMSGGVDSSVAAALLVQKGYDVTGAFMINYDDKNDLVSCWAGDYRDAVRVAAKIGIPLIKLNFTKEYKKMVLDYMYKEYKAGRTPNPDVLCNKFVKFGAWLKKAREMGFEKLATGHYACLDKGKLKEAKDKNKDQTYFLHQLNQAQLKSVLFPIGGYTKTEVRALAKKFGLPTADKEESMGICFIGEVPMKEFLQKKIKPTPGNIIFSQTGKVVGKHGGLPFYTIGERGMGINVGAKPVYVLDKNIKKNELVVGYEDDPLLYKKEIKVQDVNWISGHQSKFPLQCDVRMRHRQPLQKAKIKKSGQNLIVQFVQAQRAVTPGQFAVFYKNGECLGGGVIK